MSSYQELVMLLRNKINKLSVKKFGSVATLKTPNDKGDRLLKSLYIAFSRPKK